MIGKTLAHYEITELLGKGGMGEVYRARDTRLKRDVALKLLPADMAEQPDRLSRLQREAEAVAALNHPHIVHVYSVEEDAGVRFLTMELVEGQGLDRMLGPEGLPLPKVFEIGIAVADALAAAHEKGVIHRDLKPANVMIGKEGRVKVLDFGLAKLAEDPVVSEDAPTQVGPITTEGTTLGTVPYMSPEQLRGEEVDHRSDIFSLGILFYELATGRRPFTGRTHLDVSSSILRDTPAPVTQLNPSLPHHLGRIVSHCLEKDPRDRYHSAIDIRNELRALRKEVESGASEVSTVDSSVDKATAPAGRGKGLWMGLAAAAVVIVALVLILGRGDRASQQNAANTTAGGTSADATQAPASNSIAVMAFVNMSSDPEQEYFSDGVSEELLNLLAKIPQLKVISRSSAFSYKGKDVPLKQVAEELGVAHILEGSVRKAGNRVRITAQLIEAKSDAHLWSETYDRTLEDIFGIQDEIASDVVRQLKVKLLGETPVVRKTDPEAYTLVLQVRQLKRLGTRADFEKAIAILERALSIDPEYVVAWNALGTVYTEQAAYGLRPMDEAYPLAREAAERALAIDPNSASAHALLGLAAFIYEKDLAAAAPHCERALRLAPQDANVLAIAAALFSALGRLDECIALRQYLAARDPVSTEAYLGLGMAYRLDGRWDDAIANLRKALDLSPDRISAHFYLGLALMQKGDPPAALEATQKESLEALRLIGLAMVYHDLGRNAESDAALDALISNFEKDAAYNIAYVLAYRGEADRAFEWLEKALEYKDPGLTDVPTDQLFANLQDDPRWLPFLERIDRSPEQLAAIEFDVELPR